MLMWPIVTDGIAWSAFHDRAPCKNVNRSTCCLACGLGLAQGTTYQMEVQIANANRQF